jgi:hypothetical protein
MVLGMGLKGEEVSNNEFLASVARTFMDDASNCGSSVSE